MKSKVVEFIMKFNRWARTHKCVDVEQFKQDMKYDKLDDWKQFMIDDYIEGVLEVRDADKHPFSYSRGSYWSENDNDWMRNE